MRSRVGTSQTAINFCSCGALHFGECPYEYARYGVGTTDRRIAHPVRARVSHDCECIRVSPDAFLEYGSHGCGTLILDHEVYVSMRRPEPYGAPYALCLAHAERYVREITLGLDPDVKIGELKSPKTEEVLT